MSKLPAKTLTLAEKIQEKIQQMNLTGRDIGYLWDQQQSLEEKLKTMHYALKNISVDLDKLLKHQAKERSVVPRVTALPSTRALAGIDSQETGVIVPEPVSPSHFDPAAPGPDAPGLPIEDSDV